MSEDTQDRGLFSTLLGFAACLALVIGYFLPWVPMSEGVSESLGVDKSTVKSAALKRASKKKGKGTVASDQLGDDVAVSGSNWAAVIEMVREENKDQLTEKQDHALALAYWAVKALPWVGAACALLLLFVNLPTALAAKLGPIGWITVFARFRIISGPALILIMGTGVLVVCVGLFLWGTAHAVVEPGSTAEQAGEVGIGIQLITISGAFAFLSGMLSFRRGVRWMAVLAMVGVLALAAGAALFYVRSAAGTGS